MYGSLVCWNFFGLTTFSKSNISFDSKKKVLSETDVLTSQTIEQTMEIMPQGTRRLAAQLRTSLSFESLWLILTDYNRLSEYIPNLTSSSLLSRNGRKIKVRQVGSQNLFGLQFSAEVFLELIENEENGILKFHLTKGDFRKFEGSWTIRKLNKNQGTLLLYELTVQGCIGMPIALIEKRLRGDLKENLLAVHKAASILKHF